MHPALSVIFFTTLSGAGYGLLAWLGLSMALFSLRGPPPGSLQDLQLAGLALGLALSTIGLLCSLAHLGQPQRAWRAMSQWRTSWLSREGLLALLTPQPALAIAAVLLWTRPDPAQAALLGGLGALLALLALATVACTAMIYASLKPIPAWRHPLVVPVYLLFALSTGLGLLAVLMAWLLGGEAPATLLPVLALLGALSLALKWWYWRGIRDAPLPATTGDAIGLPGRTATVFERPHTEANYITREMAFTLARRHARTLRILAAVALLGLPLLALGLSATGVAPPLAALGLAAAGGLLGAFVERWLFFAEARHMVTLYY
ncbi:dimethyl sulfoxide reductase anchor subunit family protein [Luteimonas vadosa]|uniref:Dimethyl sulfoxide reductase anchor subunit n=1 Tax=Luteimonas vadosa TaxID=1165507 RepID=A0ABP9DP79_9GAMM